MYHKKQKNKLWISLSIVGVVILLVISFTFVRKITFVENILKTISTTANEVLFSPLKLFNSEKDVDQSKSYLIQKNVNESLEKEIEE